MAGCLVTLTESQLCVPWSKVDRCATQDRTNVKVIFSGAFLMIFIPCCLTCYYSTCILRLVEDMCTKHDLQLAHFSPPQEDTSEPVTDRGVYWKIAHYNTCMYMST